MKITYIPGHYDYRQEGLSIPSLAFRQKYHTFYGVIQEDGKASLSIKSLIGYDEYLYDVSNRTLEQHLSNIKSRIKNQEKDLKHLKSVHKQLSKLNKTERKRLFKKFKQQQLNKELKELKESK